MQRRGCSAAQQVGPRWVAKCDPEEVSETAAGDHVVRGAGGDDESGDPLGDIINPFLEWQKNGKNSKIVRKIPKLCETSCPYYNVKLS